MAKIGEDFPKSREARRKKLEEIVANQKPISTIKIPGRGIRNVYKIPLEYLSYNPYNTRFLAQAKTLEARNGQVLSDEKPEDIKEIEKFIWEYKESKNDNTLNSLAKDGQLDPGVVTPSGVILSGNRRFRLLNHIQRNYKKYAKPGVNLTGTEFFEAAILEKELDEKEIRKYESFYQYGTEDKVEYDPIQKYIAAKEQLDIGYNKTEIAENFWTLTDGKDNVVTEWIAIFEYMEEHLEYIGEPGIYTALEGREEAFINLYKTVKSFKTGKAGKNIWAFDEMDIIDLKKRYFDYIWMNLATHEFREFKTIFSHQDRWKKFNSQVNELVKVLPVDSLDEYRDKYVDESEIQISVIRENDYKNVLKKPMNNIFGEEKAVNVSRNTIETPGKIIEQISQKITKLEEIITKKDYEEIINSNDFLEGVKGLMKQIGHIKQRID